MTRYTDVILIDDTQSESEGSKILLLRRNPESEFAPSKLCLPGGHLDEGLSLIDNAKKELEEETGIIATHLSKLDNFTFESGDETTVFYGFVGVVTDEVVHPMLTWREHVEYEWLTLDEIDKRKDELIGEDLYKILQEVS